MFCNAICTQPWGKTSGSRDDHQWEWALMMVLIDRNHNQIIVITQKRKGHQGDCSGRHCPADTLRNNDVVITSKRRHFDVKMESFRRYNDLFITSCVQWMGTLKLAFNVSIDYKGSHSDDLSVSVHVRSCDYKHYDCDYVHDKVAIKAPSRANPNCLYRYHTHDHIWWYSHHLIFFLNQFPPLCICKWLGYESHHEIFLCVFISHRPLVPLTCVSESFSLGSDNSLPPPGLSPIRRQAIIQTNVGLLSIWPLRTNFNDILIKIQNLPFTKMHLQIPSAKWRLFCPGGDELILIVFSSCYLYLISIQPVLSQCDLI